MEMARLVFLSQHGGTLQVTMEVGMTEIQFYLQKSTVLWSR